MTDHPTYSSTDELLDELLARPLPDPAAPPPAVASGEQPVVRETRFGSPQDWVDAVYVVLAAGRRAPWCVRWWQHPEAFERLVWLWQSWEAAMTTQRTDPAAMAAWLHYEFDYHRSVLQALDGPFAECTTGHTGPAPALPPTDTSGTPGSVEQVAVEFFVRTRQLPDDTDTASALQTAGLAGLELR